TNQFMGEAAKRVEVGPGTEVVGLSSDLFWRHVSWGTGHARVVARVFAFEHTRNTKIGQDRLKRELGMTQENVARLDVQVKNTVRVRMRKRIEHGLEEVANRTPIQPGLKLLERSTGHVLSDHIWVSCVQA